MHDLEHSHEDLWQPISTKKDKGTWLSSVYWLKITVVHDDEYIHDLLCIYVKFVKLIVYIKHYI